MEEIARISAVTFDADVAALLVSAGLPTDDLPSPNVSLYACRLQGDLQATVGLEFYGEHALLRSLAVSPAKRNSGLGAEMLAYAESIASQRAVKALYLLTTTASAYFEQRAYVVVGRDNAPAAIMATAQFSALCPASAVLMQKPLGG